MKLAIAFFFIALQLSAFGAPTETLLDIKNSKLSLYSNIPIDAKNLNISEAIIVIHGSERNAITYFKTMDYLSHKTGKDTTTLIIAPHFKESTDPIIEKELVYSEEGWIKGDPSTDLANLSSFDVLDEMIKKLVNHFQNLKKITITGHSAGGQLTQRYSFGTHIDTEYSGIKFKFIVLNPGSYMYLNRFRPIKDSLNFTEPNLPGCAFNDYKFGTDHFNEYQSRFPLKQLIHTFLNKDMTYLIGEADILTDDIDQSCEAHIQGDNRLLRAKNMERFLDTYYKEHTHQLVIVPAVGHTQNGMYSSEAGLKLLFGL